LSVARTLPIDALAHVPEDLGRCGPQRKVVNAAAPEHRQLALCCLVVSDLERVEHEAAAKIDEGMAQPFLAQAQTTWASKTRV